MTAGGADEDDVRERISAFVLRNFPQIRAHGGDASILDVELDSGTVTLALSGACSGCGISPTTVQALQHRLVAEILEIRVVNAEVGTGGGGGTPRGFDPDDVPF